MWLQSLAAAAPAIPSTASSAASSRRVVESAGREFVLVAVEPGGRDLGVVQCRGIGTAGGATLTVFAAASLKATFTQIGTIFQTENPGSTVTFNFAGSSDLVTQLTAGAPADVFASADTNNMTKATDREPGLRDAGELRDATS